MTITPWLTSSATDASPMRSASSAPSVGLVDLAVVVGDQHQLVGEDRRVLVDEVGQLADRGERRRVRRVVVHDHRGVGATAVQLGVEVDRRRDVPLAREHGAVGVDGEEIAGAHLAPPQPPRVHEEVVTPLEGDVAGQVLAPPDVVEVAQRDRELLRGRELDPRPGHRARRPRGQPAGAFVLDGHAHPPGSGAGLDVSSGSDRETSVTMGFGRTNPGYDAHMEILILILVVLAIVALVVYIARRSRV